MVALWPVFRGIAQVPRLSVLTYNVFTGPPTPTAYAGALEGSERLRLQCKRIQELAPDVVCLQEVQSDGVRAYIEQNLPEYGATYILTDNELRESMPCLSITSCCWLDKRLTVSSCLSTPERGILGCRIGRLMRKALDSAGAGPQTTISGFLLGPVQSGLMILHRKDKLTADGRASAITFDEQGGDLLNAFRPRGALCARLRLRTDGSPVVVANTHANAESANFVGGTILGQQLPSVPLPSSPRRRQLQQLFSHVSRLTTEARVVVCGDFNSSPDLDEIPAEDHGFVDATKSTAAKRCHRRSEDECTPWLATWDGTRNPLVASGWFSEGTDAQTQLDYIFTSRDSGLDVENVSLALDDGPVPLSDHYGVLADFAVGKFSPKTARDSLAGAGAFADDMNYGEQSHAEPSQRPRMPLREPLPEHLHPPEEPLWGI